MSSAFTPLSTICSNALDPCAKLRRASVVALLGSVAGFAVFAVAPFTFKAGRGVELLATLAIAALLAWLVAWRTGSRLVGLWAAISVGVASAKARGVRRQLPPPMPN